MALGYHPTTSSTDLPTSTRRRRSLTRPLRHTRRPADPVARAGRHRVALADPDPAAPANREAPAGLADREAPAVPEDRVDLAGPEDMSRAAQAITADTGLVARANQADRVALADQVGMSLVIQADRAALASRVDQADRAAPASRVDRAVRAPGLNRALLGRAPLIRARPRLPDPHRMQEDPHRTRARPHLTRAEARPHLTRARPQEPTHPAAATHRPVPTRPAEVTHLAEVIHPAAHPAATRERHDTALPRIQFAITWFRECVSELHWRTDE
jgi:hypothetical protein